MGSNMHLQGSSDLQGMETSLLKVDSRILTHGKDGKGPQERKHKWPADAFSGQLLF